MTTTQDPSAGTPTTIDTPRDASPLAPSSMTPPQPARARRSRRWLVSSCLCVVTATALGIWWQSRADAQRPSDLLPARVSARRGDLAIRVSATGIVEPEYTVEIKSKASGVVAQVNAQEGDVVEKDTLLVKIDPVVEQRKVNQALADVRIAESQLQSLKHKRVFAADQLARSQKLLAKGLVSAEETAGLKKELSVLAGETASAHAHLLRAREALREAQDRLAETEIRAPVTGTILQRLVQPGQLVASATNTVSGGTTLVRMADLSRLYVRVKVDEADVARVKPGQPVRITADALPGQVYGGQVVRVAPEGKVESNVTVFDVLVQLDEAGRRAVRPMMSANVEIVVAEHKGVVLLPRKAVITGRRGRAAGKTLVRVGEQLRPVKLGDGNGQEVVVLAGLSAGEQVTLPSTGGTAGPAASRPRSGRGGRGRRGGRAASMLGGALGMPSRGGR